MKIKHFLTEGKSSILLIAMLLISVAGFSQKCKYFLEKKDPFTGKLTQGMSCELLKTWRMGMVKVDSLYQMDLQVTFDGVMEESINKGDTLVFAFENEKPLILYAIEKSSFSSNAVGRAYNRGIISVYNPFYVIKREDMERLATNKITAVKVYLGPSAYVVEVPEKNANKITKAAGCLL